MKASTLLLFLFVFSVALSTIFSVHNVCASEPKPNTVTPQPIGSNSSLVDDVFPPPPMLDGPGSGGGQPPNPT